MVVQTILFDRALWKIGQARAWLRLHGFGALKLDVTENKHRFRQRDPSEFEAESFRTKDIGDGVSLVMGHEK